MSSYTNTGKVKWFNYKKGFGFIIDSDGSDMFVHQSNIDAPNSFRFLKEGEDVRYNISTDSNGKQIAVNVTALNGTLFCLSANQQRDSTTSRPPRNNNGDASASGRPSRGRGNSGRGSGSYRGRGNSGRGGYSGNSRGYRNDNQNRTYQPKEGSYAAALAKRVEASQQSSENVSTTPAPVETAPVSVTVTVQAPVQQSAPSVPSDSKSTRGRKRGGKN